jgi:hypothetical protein
MNNEAVQLTLAGDTGPNVAKKVQNVIRRDMAYMLGFDTKDPNYKEFSLASVSPDMWRLWARSYGFDNEKIYPGVMREPRGNDQELRRYCKKWTRKVGRIQRIRAHVYRKSGNATFASAFNAFGAASTKPFKTGRNQSGSGFPRPPLSFVPGMPSRRQGPGFQLTGKGQGFRSRRTAQAAGTDAPGPLMVVDREREEREQARQTLERLRKKSPFARGRQAKRERAEAAMKGRRPTPPPAEPGPVTPPPEATGCPTCPERSHWVGNWVGYWVGHAA